MTNLTKQEIEKEREKFESWSNYYFGYEQNFTRINTNLFHGYSEHQLTVMWHAWLAHAELAKGE